MSSQSLLADKERFSLAIAQTERIFYADGSLTRRRLQGFRADKDLRIENRQIPIRKAGN